MFKVSYKEEEHWNTGTHATGLGLGILGACILIPEVQDSDLLSIASVWIYSLSIILLFAASASYHYVADPRIKRRLRILDHISIYFLIAGTYTPVALITLRDSSGWMLCYLVWGIALFGTFLKLFFTGKFEVFSILLYLVMGWLIVIDLNNLLEVFNAKSKLLLTLGGGFYTLGILFYAIRKIPFNHMIWHLFVLGGAISHWFMIRGLI